MSIIENDDDFISKLMLAVEKQSIKEVKNIINNYPNAKNVNINKQNKYKDQTVFMLAAQNNTNVEVIKYLCTTFKDTIDINKQDNYGNTALMYAARNNTNVEVIQYLCTTFKDT